MESSARGRQVGTFAAEHLSPSFPERAARGTASRLRAWQAEALDAYFEREPIDFLAAATPGAGKTTFALRLATELMSRKAVRRVTVVAPTEHLKVQWADAAARVGLRLDPNFSNAQRTEHRGYHGVVVTYAQVAAKPGVHRRLTESDLSLVILDEVHHAGDALSWGEAVRDAFENARRRLSLSGTPFRSDTSPIPFVEYAPDDHGIRTSVTDYNYGYGRALLDGVVRPVLFLSYTGLVSWQATDGEAMTARLGEDATKDVTAQAWRTALDPQGEWIPKVLRSAHERLELIREHVPDAGGLVIASDQTDARLYAGLLEQISGEAPTVILSDDPGSSGRISEFAESDKRWMVAVRMVSEGVDVPRLSVGVYATNASTPLFFAQAIGRFVRARRRGETASVFIPSVAPLTSLAQAMDLERSHALDRDDSASAEEAAEADMQDAERSERTSNDLERVPFAAISSDASFDKVLFDGDEFGFVAEVGTPEELEFLGLPGLLDPEQVKDVLGARQSRQHRLSEARAKAEPDENRDKPLFRTLKDQRTLLNSLVGMWARRSGDQHSHIHSELRRICGGPAVSHATVTQLQGRIDYLRRKINRDAP